VVHTLHRLRFESSGGGLRGLALRLGEKSQARLQDYLLCLLREDARTAERLRLCPASRVFDLRPGVDPGRFDPERLGRHRASVREGLGIDSGAPVVSFVGRPVRRRGVLELAEAAREVCRRHATAQFLVAGDCRAGDPTDARELLQALAGASGELAGRCHVLGRREDIPGLLAASDIFCLPTQEAAVPSALVEAMMMQLPVVATRVRGCREVVIDGQTGFLVEPRSPRDLASALCYLVEHPDVASKMGGAGRRQALEAHDLKETLASQWTVYERIIARRGAK
jgi:glycosyltransferase involved in cell wall biosynthesis